MKLALGLTFNQYLGQSSAVVVDLLALYLATGTSCFRDFFILCVCV